MTVQRLDLYLLDSLANDIENIEGILRTLNSDTVLGWHREWGRLFTRAELIEGLSRMIRDNLVSVYSLHSNGKELEEMPNGTLPPGNYDNVYFGLTTRGRLVHQNWDPPLEK